MVLGVSAQNNVALSTGFESVPVEAFDGEVVRLRTSSGEDDLVAIAINSSSLESSSCNTIECY